MVRDLTRRLHQLEAEVRRGETLAAAGEMAMGLAHEIRNPARSHPWCRAAARPRAGRETRLREYTDVLLKEVDRVNRIIEMLLDISRPVTLRPVPLNLHQLLERVALLSEEMAAERGVQIVRRYDPSLPPDPRRRGPHPAGLPQPRPQRDRGDASRRAPDPRHSAQHEPALRQGGPRPRSKSMAEMQVADEGEGIPEATRAKLFTPFFTTKDSGLGLGLALCHRIVEEHRGAIQIASEPARHRGLVLPPHRPLER